MLIHTVMGCFLSFPEFVATSLVDTAVTHALSSLHQIISFNSLLVSSLGEMGPEFSPKMPVKSLSDEQIVRIHQLFRQAKFDDPTGDVCPPFFSILLQ
jgi:hypothetical protein